MLTRRSLGKWDLVLLAAGAATALAAGGGSGCAQGTADFNTGGSTTTNNATSTAKGTGGSAGGSSICTQDCSAIATPPCLKSVCNEGMYQGTIGECVIVPDEGAACEDGEFCTIQDTCDAMGQCIGGPPNDCGMTPGQCKEIACNEDTDSCGEIASMPGAPCQDPANLCLKGSTCNNGVCSGGTIDDCFFFPVSNDCHVAECDPADGMCHEQIGNEGDPCVDVTALCTIGKTCNAGNCVGGTPKDCSALTMGCFDGVCDMATGNCIQQPIMPGQQCAEATDQCNIGICDTLGNCNATPANQGMPCNDGNACNTGETCNNGACTGGTAVTTCMSGDLCCPPSCSISNDADCNTSCLGLLQSNPNAPDGPYQILENMVMVTVYCDMTHGGVTYRELAMGDYTVSFPGYTMMSVADLSDPVIQQAFVFLYNQQGGAINNLNPGWNSNNCCVKLAEHVSSNSFLTLGGDYIYPAGLGNTIECNTGYFATQYRFYQATSNTFSPAVMSSNYFALEPPGTITVCTNSNNPAWFWKKF